MRNSTVNKATSSFYQEPFYQDYNQFFEEHTVQNYQIIVAEDGIAFTLNKLDKGKACAIHSGYEPLSLNLIQNDYALFFSSYNMRKLEFSGQARLAKKICLDLNSRLAGSREKFKIYTYIKRVQYQNPRSHATSGIDIDYMNGSRLVDDGKRYCFYNRLELVPSNKFNL